MEDAQKQLVDKLKSASNVLVTISRDPSVDQLAALIGLTLLLNKADKHAAAVFSGNVPSTIEFLQPEETIEKNTDSLRDFIIALDKSKADKLRYKVEDNVVRIFITPYKTSISQDDFEFSQGDFNVDLVIALGVKQQDDLDEAIMAHGQILHDATVASVNIASDGGLGTINWHSPNASSLSEMVTKLGQAINEKLFDEQISTALMTGIVAETDRFSNEKTSSETMSVSAKLMSSGANQQLVASKLMDAGALASIDVQKDDSAISANPVTDDKPVDLPKSSDGSLEIDHNKPEQTVEIPPEENAPPTDTLPTFELPALDVENLPSESSVPNASEADQNLSPGPKLMTEPPTMGGQLTASGQDLLEPTGDPLSMPKAEAPMMLEHTEPPKPANTDGTSTAPPLPELTAIGPDPSQPTEEVRTHETLSELEEAVASPHLKNDPSLGTARDEVTKALNDLNATETPHAEQSINSQQLGPELHPSDLSSDPSTPVAPAAGTPTDTNSPPPVPPPIPFQFGNPPPSK